MGHLKVKLRQLRISLNFSRMVLYIGVREYTLRLELYNSTQSVVALTLVMVAHHVAEVAPI